MLAPQSRYTTMDATLPSDPEPNQVYTMPEGQIAGASYILHIYKNGILIGSAEALTKVQNVSGKSYLSRMHSKTEIKEGDRLEILFVRLLIKSVKYVEYFGWIGHTFYPETQIEDKFLFDVVTTLPIQPLQEHLHVYERVCLTRVKGEIDDNRTTESST